MVWNGNQTPHSWGGEPRNPSHTPWGDGPMFADEPTAHEQSSGSHTEENDPFPIDDLTSKGFDELRALRKSSLARGTLTTFVPHEEEPGIRNHREPVEPLVEMKHPEAPLVKTDEPHEHTGFGD